MRRDSYEMVQTRGNAAYGGNWLTCGLALIFRESFFYIKGSLYGDGRLLKGRQNVDLYSGGYPSGAII